MVKIHTSLFRPGPGNDHMLALNRYHDAQNPVWNTVVRELKSARKQSHWSWYIFPQIYGLGVSHQSKEYAIQSLDEAIAYWQDAILGERLRQSIEILIHHQKRHSPAEILGTVDAMKLCSCLTLFEYAIPAESLFPSALELLFSGKRDKLTLEILGSS